MPIDTKVLDRAVEAFRDEELHWEVLPVRALGQAIEGRRHNSVPPKGSIRMPSESSYQRFEYRSAQERADAVFRACVARAVEAAAAPKGSA